MKQMQSSPCPYCGAEDWRLDAYTNEAERIENVLCNRCGWKRSTTYKRNDDDGTFRVSEIVVPLPDKGDAE